MCGLNHIAGNHVVGSSLPANLYLDVFLFNAPISEAKHSYAGPSDEGEAGGQLVMGQDFHPVGHQGPPRLFSPGLGLALIVNTMLNKESH